ncbi:1,2-epoxyphenylacetyl-CoA isomerase [compost metagenome]
MNPLCRELVRSLRALLAQLRDDREVHVLVVTGEGKAFSAGADLAARPLRWDARAQGMSLLGDRLPAEQAAAWGLIWACVDDDSLREQALAAAGGPQLTARSVAP